PAPGTRRRSALPTARPPAPPRPRRTSPASRPGPGTSSPRIDRHRDPRARAHSRRPPRPRARARAGTELDRVPAEVGILGVVERDHEDAEVVVAVDRERHGAAEAGDQLAAGVV